ncbi:MAG: metalloregulator ArsR/SmtB family transcription factor [Rhodospirillales bacterium]
MNLNDMTLAAERVSDLMKSLAHKNRLLILCHLIEQEHSVGELARLLKVRDQAMSQQLSLLRKDGLVQSRRDGQTVYYSIARDDIHDLMAFLHKTYCESNVAAQ